MNPKKLPDDRFTITDDAEAQAFLATIGILDKLLKQGSLTDLGAGKVNTVAVCHYSHETHWILACRFHGLEDEKENGFMVLGWPKNKFPRSVLEDAIKAQNLGEPESRKDFNGPTEVN